MEQKKRTEGTRTEKHVFFPHWEILLSPVYTQENFPGT